jgi:hypothetical protein
MVSTAAAATPASSDLSAPTPERSRARPPSLKITPRGQTASNGSTFPPSVGPTPGRLAIGGGCEAGRPHQRRGLLSLARDALAPVDEKETCDRPEAATNAAPPRAGIPARPVPPPRHSRRQPHHRHARCGRRRAAPTCSTAVAAWQSARQRQPGDAGAVQPRRPREPRAPERHIRARAEASGPAKDPVTTTSRSRYAHRSGESRGPPRVLRSPRAPRSPSNSVRWLRPVRSRRPGERCSCRPDL